MRDPSTRVRPMPDWFVLNLSDSPAGTSPRSGTWTEFEPPGGFEQYGVNVHVVKPGQANCLYHEESNQEDFLVLHGECILVVEEQERRLRQWDFFHCPPGTRHVFVGAGDGPCAILMIGARDREDRHRVSGQRGGRPPQRVRRRDDQLRARGLPRLPAGEPRRALRLAVGVARANVNGLLGGAAREPAAASNPVLVVSTEQVVPSANCGWAGRLGAGRAADLGDESCLGSENSLGRTR